MGCCLNCKNNDLNNHKDKILFEPKKQSIPKAFGEKSSRSITTNFSNSTVSINENIKDDINSQSSESSEGSKSNNDSFELTIRYKRVNCKLKVKGYYTISKVIYRFIKYNCSIFDSIHGRLTYNGRALAFNKTLYDLDISEYDTLDLY